MPGRRTNVNPFKLSSFIVALLACLFTAIQACADDDRDEARAGKAAGPAPSITTALPFFADVVAYRQRLFEHGVQYQFIYIGDAQDNLTGGVRRGATYAGRLETVLDIDLEKFAGMQGAAVHFNTFAIQGRGLSRYNITNILTVSEIEALSTVRLSEVWYEQKLGDKAFLRAGQLAADTEFFTSKSGGLFVNATFGWPGIFDANLPSGGPAYPFAAPGARLKIVPGDNMTILAAIFNGDPAGPGPDDPQRRNRFGVNFRFRDPPLVMTEAQLTYGSVKDGLMLPGTIKVGAWTHFGRFDDLRLSAERISTADPSSSGIPLRRRGNDGIYAVVDQMIYHLPGEDEDKGVGVFVRASGSPADRNLVSFYVDAGLNFNGMVPGRPADSFGIAGAYARLSPTAALLDQEKALLSGSPTPIRNYEGLIELTYQAQIMTGWSMQPNVQYIFHPGGGIADPNDRAGIRRIRDAAIVGVRSTMRF
jgi:porin